jgi:ADP-ribosylglycohydrolase
MKVEPITGCILGTAVGDALGLPYEGLSPQRAARLFQDRARYHFLFSKGMVSDDTEHTCMVAQALIASEGDPEQFAEELAQRFRVWLLGLPAGIGFATLRAIVKLWLGFSPDRSGVFSAGNGPAMRAGIIGVSHGRESEKLKALVRRVTVITHTDPKAYYGALAVALAAHLSATGGQIEGKEYCAHLERLLQDEKPDEFLGLIEAAVQSAQQGRYTTEFVQSLGLQKGITGYIYHTVPAVIHAWLVNPQNFRGALLDIISCGGDTDTTAAILGGIVGAGVGKGGIPEDWLNNLIEWPRTVVWMESLSHQLGNRALSQSKAIELPVLKVALRNILFTLVVLLHGFRRLFPPY